MTASQTARLTRNLAALETVQPALAAYLKEHCRKEGEALNLFESASGDLSGRYAGITLHSRHNPREESERLFRQTDGEMACYLLEGFGMGYLAETVRRLAPDAHIVVVEPDLDLFVQVLSARDLSDLLQSKQVSYLFETGQDSIDRVLDTFPANAIGIIRFRPLYERHRRLYAGIDTAIENHVTRREVNRNTLARFGPLWVRNLALNLPVFARARPLSEVENLFSGLPGLLLGGGPSLDNMLAVLPLLAERCLIAAVDTSLGPCLRAGVEPDFVIVVDPQYWNTRHLDGCRPAKSILISESSTHPRVFRQMDGPVHFCSSLFPLGEYLEEQTGTLGKLGAGGSVSTSAWDFLRIAGCKPIYIAGIDLGFPDRQTHFRGSFFEERIHTLGSRLSPGEMHMFRYLNDAGLFQLPANDGGTVDTDRRMTIYRWWFERQAERYPDADTRTLSKRAVKLKGIPPAELDELLDAPRIRSVINERLQSLSNREARPPAGSPSARQSSREKMRGAVQSLIDELEEIERTAAEGSATVVSLRNRTARAPENSSRLDDLDAVDSAIFSLKHRDIVGFLLQKDMQRIIDRARKAATLEETLSDSEAIYGGLCESARYHRICLQRGLSRLNS